jgi:ATP synthase assembly factor FMC1
MSTTTPHLRSLYRRLLRELPVKDQTTRTAHQKLSAASPLQKRLRAQLTSPVNAPATEASQTSQAEQFVQYVQAQRMYATLIERYNPGMGMSEEERVRLSARRIGMNLPAEYEVPEVPEVPEGTEGGK